MNVIEKPNYIHESVWLGDFITIRPGVAIGEDSEIRNYCFLAEGCRIGKGVKVFHYSNIASGSVIEDRVYIGVRVTLINTWKISHGRKYPPEMNAPVIRFGARIGSGAIIMPGIEIAEQSLIGAGSVVCHDTKPFGKYMGNPAIFCGEVEHDERL